MITPLKALCFHPFFQLTGKPDPTPGFLHPTLVAPKPFLRSGVWYKDTVTVRVDDAASQISSLRNVSRINNFARATCSCDFGLTRWPMHAMRPYRKFEPIDPRLARGGVAGPYVAATAYRHC